MMRCFAFRWTRLPRGWAKKSGSRVFFCLVLFFIWPLYGAWARGPSLSVDTFSVNFSTPTERTLDEGHMDRGRDRGVQAVKVRVNGGDEGQGWKLYLRADNRQFSPGAFGKGCGDLEWKFDHENPNSYRKVRSNNQFVASGSGSRDITKYIDLRMVLDWSDPQAGYNLGLTFILKTQ